MQACKAILVIFTGFLLSATAFVAMTHTVLAVREDTPVRSEIKTEFDVRVIECWQSSKALNVSLEPIDGSMLPFLWLPLTNQTDCGMIKGAVGRPIRIRYDIRSRQITRVWKSLGDKRWENQ